MSEEYQDQDGWTHGCYYYKPGFTQLLWQILQDQGFTDPSLYFWKKKNSANKVCCIAYVHIPESDEHPSWSLDESWEEGFEFADTIERTVFAALTELCKRNKIEIGTSPARYFL